MSDPASVVVAVSHLGEAVAHALNVPDSVKVDRSRRIDENRAQGRLRRGYRRGRRIRRTLAVIKARADGLAVELADLECGR